MTKETGLAPSHFSEAAKELEIWGYVTRRRHDDGRRWVYWVTYQGDNSGHPELSPTIPARRKLNVPLPVGTTQPIQRDNLCNRSLKQTSVKEGGQTDKKLALGPAYDDHDLLCPRPGGSPWPP
jgi:hypothetical protein